MEGLEVTKTISLEQSISVPRQTEVRIPAAGNAAIWLNVRAAKSAALCVIFCILFNLWINSEHSGALIAQSSVSVAGPRITNGLGFGNDRGITNDRGFAGDRHENRPVPDGLFSGGGNGMFQNLGVVLFVSGLSPDPPQGFAQRPGLPDPCAGVREPSECRQAGEERWFPLYLQILASVLLCGLVSWSDAVWMGRR
jgi:hypothetical protein